MENRHDVEPILYDDRRMEEFHDSGFNEPLVVEEGGGVENWEPGSTR